MNAEPAETINFAELDPATEVGHLRRLLDVQPSCLLRLRDDGLVLAANDVALKLLGVETLSQALGRNFAGWIVQEQREQWLAYAEQVVKGTASSIECDLTGPPGGSRPTLFHAIPVTDHPDGIPSIAVSARAVADRRQLEAVIERLEGQIHQLEAEREATKARLEGQIHQLEAEREAAKARLEGQTHQLEAEREAAKARLEGQLHQIEAEREAGQARFGQLQAEFHQARLSQSGLDERIRELKSEHAAENEAARSERDKALADLARTEAKLEELRAHQQRLADERATERERVLKMLQQVVTEHERELHEARSAAAEQSRLAPVLEEREATIRQLDASNAEANAQIEQLQAERARFEALLTERDLLIRRLEETKAATDQTIAELAADRENLALAMNDRDAAIRRIGESKTRAEAELAELQGARERLQVAIDERDTAVRRYEDVKSKSDGDLGQLRAMRERLELALRDAGERQERLAASAAAECVRLQQLLDVETERNRDERRLREAETQERLESLQAQINESLRSARESQELLREREAAIQESIAAYDAVIAERDRLLETAADQAVQLGATAERERHMMKLALIGRLARDIATQMKQQIEQVGEVAGEVLHATGLDDAARPKLERLRGHAIQAAALADDMLLVGTNPQGSEHGPIPPATKPGSSS